ncbi:Pfs domain-protein [Podospora aff. communis PSN243]|uniref:Pfs domain-protein n=1 Tax=Podospora aff. communis PSN243 TaxID=3040156 RepID=A0AAV9GBU6_9PEZI|nr:Pfs domain-protein [Podospora aff. communis PSN243]
MARVDHLEMQKSVKLSTHAVLFLATPHQGGEGVQLAEIMRRVFSVVSYTNQKLLEQVQRHSTWLQDLQARYNAISRDVETWRRFSSMKHMRWRFLFSGGSSVLVYFSMSADHSSIVKYHGATDPNYERVSIRLRVLISRAAPRVRQNWVRWNTIREIELRWPPAEMLHNTPTSSSHFKLVVLYGIGGVGKTQIALEHAYLSKSKYSAIFWIDGSSKESALLGIWRCLERNAYHYSSIGAEDNARFRRIKEALQHVWKKENAQGPPKPDFMGTGNRHQDPKAQDLQLLAGAFTYWLSLGSNKHWLIILDNVDDIESYDFRELLPKTEHGSVIVTTRRSDLAVNWDAIEVTDMDTAEAIALLMMSMKSIAQDKASEWDAAKRLVAMMMLNYKDTKALWDYRGDTTMTTGDISYFAIHCVWSTN